MFIGVDILLVFVKRVIHNNTNYISKNTYSYIVKLLRMYDNITNYITTYKRKII